MICGFAWTWGTRNIEGGIAAAFESMRERVVTTHVHDNHGESDEHLMPYEGKIDWDATLQLFAEAPHALPIVLELKEHATPAGRARKSRARPSTGWRMNWNRSGPARRKS